MNKWVLFQVVLAEIEIAEIIHSGSIYAVVGAIVCGLCAMLMWKD